MKIGFDLISDLNIDNINNFNWEDKTTSLYCLLAGNVSSDLKVVEGVLSHLSRFYQGVFYVPGSLEFSNTTDYKKRINELSRICKRNKNIAFLHHHVVIIDGIAVLGCTGYYGKEYEDDFEITYRVNRFDDLVYLKNSIERLQKHLDVKKILLMTNSIPSHYLHFGSVPYNVSVLPELALTLFADSESKVSHWAYGTSKNIVDTSVNGINYVCNPFNNTQPYWAKRIDVEI